MKDLAMAKVTPGEFVRQVRQETRKVTWPTSRDTLVTTAMVGVMTVVLALFFLLVDQVLSFGIKAILGLGN
jgi:preprotein translocase subunit SecE